MSARIDGSVGEVDGWRRLVREFLQRELPSGWTGIGSLTGGQYYEFIEWWRERLFEHGLLALSWPVEYGGAGLTLAEQVVAYEEFARAGVPNGGITDEFGIAMLGNTILRWGTEAQRCHFLPRALSGEHRWCQGYSEPGSGSDLASLRCRAELDGDEWVLNGQKVWTSAGHLANWIFVLARTDRENVGHAGISFLLVPLDQDGIDIRPIKMLSGHEDFNEVFFSGARTLAANVVGEIGGGWDVAMTLLSLERGGRSMQIMTRFEVELERLLVLARERRASDDPLLRREIADLYITVKIMRFVTMQELRRTLDGAPPGPGSAVFKLMWSEYHQRATATALRILGPDALVSTGRPPMIPFRADDPGAPNNSASWLGAFYNSRAGTIYAGTSEIQRNVIAERELGLPRDRASSAER